MVRYCSNNMSCTPPQMYRDRFVNYMSKVIVKSSSFNSAKNPLIERFKSIERHSRNHIGSNPHNSSNNILIQNNTNNFYNIINNNNNIMMNSIDDKTINNNTTNSSNNKNISSNNNTLSLKKEKSIYLLKYNTKEVIKEESEHGGMSAGSGSSNNKNKSNSGLGLNASEEKT